MSRRMRSRRGRSRGEQGSAAIWTLAGCALLVLAGGVVGARTLAVLARHRAESSADLAALAAAVDIGVGGQPCRDADRVARANGADLRSCLVQLADDGRSGTVSVEVGYSVRLPFAGAHEVVATARAARLPAGRTVSTGLNAGPTAGTNAAPMPAPAWAPVPVAAYGMLAVPNVLGSAGIRTLPSRSTRGGCPMEISVAGTPEDAPPVVVAVSGEVDVYSAPTLADRLNELLRRGDTHLVVDLRQVDFLDSTGLGVLVEARAAAAEAGGALPLVCSQERIRKLFAITGLDTVFTIHETLDSALAAARG